MVIKCLEPLRIDEVNSGEDNNIIVRFIRLSHDVYRTFHTFNLQHGDPFCPVFPDFDQILAPIPSLLGRIF